MTCGACAIFWRTASSVALFGGSEAVGSAKVTSTRTGPSAPGPSACAAALTPPRISWSGSNWRSMLLPRLIQAAGAAMMIRKIAANNAVSHGRCMVRSVQRLQNGDWVASGRRLRCSQGDRRAARLPKVASTAGVRVVEVSTAMATATMAPVAMEFRTGVSMR